MSKTLYFQGNYWRIRLKLAIQGHLAGLSAGCPFFDGRRKKEQSKETEGEMINKTMSGKRIKEIMRSSDITVKDLQEELGLRWPQSIYLWLKGTNLPSVDSLYTLSRMTGVHMEDLLVEEK